MVKTFGMVAAAALLASVTAFAQDAAPAAPSSDQASAPAAAPADDSGKPMHKHHHHGSSTASRGSKGTDMNADKLNSCMSNATPTAQQEECLKSASGTGNG